MSINKRKFLVAVLVPDMRKETYVIEELTNIDFEGKVLIFYYNLHKDVKDAIIKLQKKREIEKIKLTRSYQFQLYSDASILNKIKENEDEYDYSLFIKSTVVLFPKILFQEEGLPRILLAPTGDKRFPYFEFFLIDNELLKIHGIDIDFPFQVLINQVSCVKRPVLGLSSYVNDVPTNFPSWLYIEITTKCNLMCKYCDRKTWNDIESVMEPKVFDNIIKKVRKVSNISGINIIGLGEPLVHPKCYQIQLRYMYRWMELRKEVFRRIIEKFHLN